MELFAFCFFQITFVMTRAPKKSRPVKLPLHGNALHNSGIQISIGGLVIHWANNESVFLAMLKLLAPGTAMTEPIIWQSLRTSRPRLDLVLRLARERVEKDKTL